MYEMMKLAPEMEKFIETLPAKHRASNVYEIICEDKDGNITERKFGVNVMTNNGFTREYKTDENTWYYHMIFGTGSGTPAITDTVLFQRIPNSPLIGETLYDAGVNVINNYFDPVTNIITGRRRTGQCVLDYNYSWLIEDTNITEFAEVLNTNENSINTHALIYDANHQPSYFTKRLNEKVTINIYRANSINASLFDTLWNEGKYFFINPAYCVKAMHRHAGVSARNCFYVSGRAQEIDQFPMYPVVATDVNGGFGGGLVHSGYNVGLGYNNSGACTSGSGTNPCHYSVAIEGGLRSNLTLPEMVITSKRVIQVGQGLFLPDGMSNWSYGEHGYKRRAVLYWIENFNLTTPEELTFDFAYVDDFVHNTFTSLFGGFTFLAQYAENDSWSWTWQNNILPVNDFHITAVKGYNYLTGEFDRVESFIDDPDYDFRNPELFLYGYYHTAEFHGPDGTTIFDVFINTRTDIAITGFYDASTFSIYMTDKYWDASTFVKLDDNRVVPQALQHKKYIIKTPNQYPGAGNMKPGIHPQRERNKHALDVSYTELNIENNFTLANDGNRNVHNVFASDTGWVWYVNKLIYPESDDGNGHPYMHHLPGPASGDRRYVWHSDDWIIWAENWYLNNAAPAVAMKAMKIDPTHPDVDPSTTAIDYSFSFFTDFLGPITDRYTYFDNYCIKLFDRYHNRLVLIKTNTMGYIDFDTDPTTIVPIEVTSVGAHLCSFVWDTNYFVIYTGRGANDEFQFSIYDFTTNTVAKTFEIPLEGTMSLRGIFAYADTIYIQIYRDNTTWYMYTYNILSEGLVAHPNAVWVNTANVQGSYLASTVYSSSVSLDDDALIFHGLQHDQSHTGSRSFVILKNDQENPIYLHSRTGDHANSYVLNACGPPSIKKMNGGKDYVIMVPGWMVARGNGNTQYDNWWSAYNILNLGYIINKGWRTPGQLNNNLPIMTPHMPCLNGTDRGGPGYSGATTFPYPRFDSSTVWFGEACFYKNDVIVFTTFSKPLRIPIEMFLFHQITGTTKTIQAFNNPKKIAANSHGLMITNDI